LTSNPGVILAFIFAGAVVAVVAIVLTVIDIRNGRKMSGRSIGTFVGAGALMLVGIIIALT
jgi:NADH:ubiquinone oxidoreductase subunit 6 (subunit J)